MQDCGDELDLLLIAFRERLHFFLRARFQAKSREPSKCCFGCLSRWHSLKAAEIRERAKDRHVLVEPALFRQVSEIPFDATARVERAHDRSLVGLEKSDDHADQRRLARSVWAQEGDDLAFVDGNAQVIDCDDLTESLADPLCGNECRHTVISGRGAISHSPSAAKARWPSDLRG